MKLGIATIALALPLVLAGACSSASGGSTGASSAPTASVPRVSGAEARRLVEAGALLLDVRTGEEFADGHIDGARNVPLDRLAEEMGGLPRDKPIVVYCAVGSRASVAARLLKARGYDVRNMGAISAWDR